MAGLLAWAADVVGGGGQTNGEDESIRLVFTPEQQQYAIQLDQTSSTLKRSIQDLRSRLPPPDISQRLPHHHAHSLASNAALALQQNAHSSTKLQIQLREVTLQEENAAFEKAISDCENKIQEKLEESNLLETKLQEMESTEENLKAELEKSLTALNTRQSGESSNESRVAARAEASKYKLQEELENKKQELLLMEEKVQDLEKRWALVQENALKHPSPVQREKLLDRQLHSLIEQLASKQAQAEGLVSEIHLKEMEFERLNGLWKRLEANTMEANIARNRFGRSNSEKESLSSDYIVDPHHRPYGGGRLDNQKRLMLLRSAFVVYILALHILVFIRISF